MINNLYKMFLGSSPSWYKNTIIAFLIFNPIALYTLNYLGFNGSFVIGWLLLLQFIFTLALALKCYPLQPGGLLAIQALLIGLTSPYTLLHEVENNLEVILLLVFISPDGTSLPMTKVCSKCAGACFQIGLKVQIGWNLPVKHSMRGLKLVLKKHRSDT